MSVKVLSCSTQIASEAGSIAYSLPNLGTNRLKLNTQVLLIVDGIGFGPSAVSPSQWWKIPRYATGISDKAAAVVICLIVRMRGRSIIPRRYSLHAWTLALNTAVMSFHGLCATILWIAAMRVIKN
jgi:hypothetical protein